MQDEPRPAEILAAVADFLRRQVIPQATALVAFKARVAANAVDLVARQLELAPAGERAELASLQVLLDRDGTLAELNAALAEGIASGGVDANDPAVGAHLRATTLAKLAVDQPRYSGYLAALDKDA